MRSRIATLVLSAAAPVTIALHEGYVGHAYEAILERQNE